MAAPEQLLRLLITRPAALLHPDLHDAIVFARRVHHPAPLLDEQRHGLFDVDVFTSGAGEDREQGVPMVRC